MASKYSHVFLMTMPPINYENAEPVEQKCVDFQALHDALEELFMFSKFGIAMASPKFFLDLKAVSDLRRLGPKSMGEYQAKLGKLLNGAAKAGGSGLLECPAAVEMVTELNIHNHCPAMFYMVINADNESLLKWANERLADGLGFDPHNNLQINMPVFARESIQKCFDDKVMYQPTASFMPVDVDLFRSALVNEINIQTEKEAGMNVIQRTSHRLRNRMAGLRSSDK